MNDPSGAEHQPEVDLFKPYQPDSPTPHAAPTTVSAPPRRRGRSRWPWVLGAVGVVVVAAVVAAVLVLVFPGNDGDPMRTPEGAAQAFVDAINARDVDGVNKLTCSDEDKVDRGELATTAAGTTQIQVKSVSVPNNGQAVLTVTAVVENQQTQDRFPMNVRPDGTWCVGEQGATTR